MEVIPEYVNTLEDAQKQSKRAGNPIMADNLLIITTNDILSTENFPPAEKIWEDLSKEKKDWCAWKKMYNVADRKAKVKKKSVGVQDRFGAAHGALTQAPQSQQANGPTMLEADLDEYFDNLSAASTTDKGVLEELVKSNASLTTTNTELSTSVDSLINSNEQLSRRVGNRRNKHTQKDSPAPCPKTFFPISISKSCMPPIISLVWRKILPDALGDGKVVCDNGGHLK